MLERNVSLEPIERADIVTEIDSRSSLERSTRHPIGRSCAQPGGGLPSWIVVVIAASGGLVVANLYYAQPLLHAISIAFDSPPSSTGLLITATQFGFAAGLVMLVPLGDLLERRRMILILLLLSSIALSVSALAPSLTVLELSAIAVGTTSVVAQVLVSFVATVATEQHRGRMVGQTMSGLLLGIVLARTVSGALAQLAGWRSIYWAAAGAMLVMSLLLARVLPRLQPQLQLGYGTLLHSVAVLFKQEPVLRRRSFYGATSFAAFSVLWTNLAFLLSKAPYHYDTVEIGLFGLAGATGATCASLAGRLTDRGHARVTTIVFLSASTGAFLLLLWGRELLIPLIVGIVLLDLGVWGAQVTNQSLIYRLRPQAQSRITTIYMTSYFIGGAIGSAASTAVYSAAGWRAACMLGMFFGLIAIAFWATELRRLGNYYELLTPKSKPRRVQRSL
ncbi:MAG: MFS transporter [Actinobacteria bacterium]|jgi:predicted MFS family arabinose efflux permease|nr:MFS transporter [Actinomycetota bacterium]MCL6095726.1 MFS transporter [Actinomycetota bacterium]